MGSPFDLRGVYVPLITPFDEADRVDIASLKALSERYLDAGAAGLVALGTTGEPATLDADEKAAVVETVGAVCHAKSAQFIVGAGTNSTRATLDAVAGFADAPGLSAVLAVVPYYTRPSEEGIVAHYRAIAEASPVPVVAYNIPYRTGRGLGAQSLIELSRTPNMAGLKQSVGGVDADTLELMANKANDFDVVSGDDAFIYPLLTLGGTGAIAAAAHVCTEAFVAMVDAGVKGDYPKAREIAERLLPVCTSLFTEPSPGIVKGVLARKSLIATPNLRAPMTNASADAVHAALRAIDAV